MIMRARLWLRSIVILELAAVIAGLAIAVALVATWIPARRAASIDPLLARTE